MTIGCPDVRLSSLHMGFPCSDEVSGEGRAVKLYMLGQSHGEMFNSSDESRCEAFQGASAQLLHDMVASLAELSVTTPPASSLSSAAPAPRRVQTNMESTMDTSCATLEGIPTEILQRAIDFVDAYWLPNLRLVSRTVSAASMHAFAAEFLHDLRCYVLDPARLRRIMKIVATPGLASHIRTLLLTVDCFERHPADSLVVAVTDRPDRTPLQEQKPPGVVSAEPASKDGYCIYGRKDWKRGRLWPSNTSSKSCITAEVQI